MSDKTFRVLVACQNEYCAEEQTFFLDHLRWWNDQPICEPCFDEERAEFQSRAPANAVSMTWEELEPLKLEQARS